MPCRNPDLTLAPPLRPARSRRGLLPGAVRPRLGARQDADRARPPRAPDLRHHRSRRRRHRGLAQAGRRERQLGHLRRRQRHPRAPAARGHAGRNIDRCRLSAERPRRAAQPQTVRAAGCADEGCAARGAGRFRARPGRAPAARRRPARHPRPPRHQCADLQRGAARGARRQQAAGEFRGAGRARPQAHLQARRRNAGARPRLHRRLRLEFPHHRALPRRRLHDAGRQARRGRGPHGQGARAARRPATRPASCRGISRR